ncbi:hypothetical protein QYE76_006189 [Lolium multiflorum]|uniref:Uncharacterized protein n=1 Tax=Lolium multiflorum TaxID=4521 RepID=A0AAD8RWB7_LOLMU|nr:hypothetical protein QYE76_006189 [Lolium multiflorum]
MPGETGCRYVEIQDFKKGVGEFFDKLVANKRRIFFPGDNLLRMESLRSSYQELEIKLKEAEPEGACREATGGETPSSSGKGEFVLKRNADSETIKRQQKELNGLRKYMETAEHHWDLLAENILEPLGYPERRRNKFPRDDVLSLGDDCKDLISASLRYAITCH